MSKYNEIQVGDTMKFHDLKDFHTTYNALKEFGYICECNFKDLILTIVEVKNA